MPDFTVSGNAVVLVDPLAIGDWFMCAAVHTLTSGDADNLERKSAARVSSGDMYDFELPPPDAQVVGLNQVRTMVLFTICAARARGRGVVGCCRRCVDVG